MLFARTCTQDLGSMIEMFARQPSRQCACSGANFMYLDCNFSVKEPRNTMLAQIICVAYTADLFESYKKFDSPYEVIVI